MLRLVFVLFLLLGKISPPAYAGKALTCPEYFKILSPSEFQPAKKALHSRILALADDHSFVFESPAGARKFESGDPVSLSWMPADEAMARAKTGIFIGSAERDGQAVLLLDEGWGKVATIPVSELRTMHPSTTNARPSKGSRWEKLDGHVRYLWRLNTDYVFPIVKTVGANAVNKNRSRLTDEELLRVVTEVEGHEVDGLRTIVLPSTKTPAVDFQARAEAAVAAALTVKNYLYEIGVPSLSKAIPVVISEDPFGDLDGPFSSHDHLIYLGPQRISEAERALYSRQYRDEGADLRFSSEEDLRAMGLDPTVAAHELAHSVLFHYMTAKGNWKLSGLINEFGADYFSLSGLAQKEPVMAHGAYFASTGFREGVSRGYPEPYPPALNVNSIAQLSGTHHPDSQLLLRVVWRLREKIGRENLDPLILKAFLETRSLRTFSQFLFPMNNQIDVSIRETYVFAAALKKALVSAGKKDEARLWLEILEEVDMPAAMVERVLSK